MLAEARRIAGNEGPITEPILFRAFCATADEQFKAGLKLWNFGVDLDRLDSTDAIDLIGLPASELTIHASPDVVYATVDSGIVISNGNGARKGTAGSYVRNQFDDRAWAFLAEAGALARSQGWDEIRTPHLFAALIGNGNTSVGKALLRGHVDPAKMKSAVLLLVPQGLVPHNAPGFPTIGPNAFTVLSRAYQSAFAQQRTHATETDIIKAFFADGGGPVGALLAMAGVSVSHLT
jgi:hypothetical protein